MVSINSIFFFSRQSLDRFKFIIFFFICDTFSLRAIALCSNTMSLITFVELEHSPWRFYPSSMIVCPFRRHNNALHTASTFCMVYIPSVLWAILKAVSQICPLIPFNVIESILLSNHKTNLQTGKTILYQFEGLYKLWDTP